MRYLSLFIGIVNCLLVSSCGSGEIRYTKSTESLLNDYKLKYNFFKILILESNGTNYPNLVQIYCSGINKKSSLPIELSDRKLIMKTMADAIYQSLDWKMKSKVEMIVIDFTIWKSNRILLNEGESEACAFKIHGDSLHLTECYQNGIKSIFFIK